ncbi:MAG TPA: hypothetical protein VFY65_07365 [Longimicrobium sp.]|nr:hypothetical protein [Longimicrobium sp.]
MAKRRTEFEQMAITVPEVRRFVNQCGGCASVGVKPDAPDEFTRFGPMGPGLRARIGVLALDDRGLCELCARLLDERAAHRPP